MPRRKEEQPEDIDAERGEKMIKITLRFDTNKLGNDGKLRKKHMWDGGWVILEKNGTHGLPAGHRRFKGVHEITPAIVDLLKKGGVRVHRANPAPFV